MWKRMSSDTPPLRPEQHVALVTGASQGLGRAFAEQCARLGIDLILVALPGSGLPRVAQGIELLYGVRSKYVEMDLTAPGNPEALAEWISRQGLHISMLINNAGVGYNSRCEDYTPAPSTAQTPFSGVRLERVQHGGLLPHALHAGVRAVQDLHPQLQPCPPVGDEGYAGERQRPLSERHPHQRGVPAQDRVPWPHRPPRQHGSRPGSGVRSEGTVRTTGRYRPRFSQPMPGSAGETRAPSRRLFCRVVVLQQDGL
jgi:hypothetical protein